jgi:hypothetical protein
MEKWAKSPFGHSASRASFQTVFFRYAPPLAMKTFFALTAALALLAPAMAQIIAEPETRANPSPALTLEPKNEESLGLIPEAPEPRKKPKGTALVSPGGISKKSVKNETSATEDELRARIRLRELKTKVSRDPQVQAELERASTALTDYEKREALKAYYNLLYGKIEKLDRSLKKRVDVLRKQSIHRLEQTRIDPTHPVDPVEQGDRLGQTQTN